MFSRRARWLAVIIALCGCERVESKIVACQPRADIVVLLDRSTSMRQTGRGDLALKGIGSLFAHNAELALLGVARQTKVLVPFVAPNEWAARLNGIDDGDALGIADESHGTDLGEGIREAVHLVSGRKTGVVLLVGDSGSDTVGPVLPEAAARMAADKGIVIHTLLVGDSRAVDLGHLPPDGRELAAIARITHGRALAASNASEMASALRSFNEAVDGYALAACFR